MSNRQYRQPLTTQDLNSLRPLAASLTGEAEFHDWFRFTLESLTPDSSLKGQDMREEIYKQACMKEGAVRLYKGLLLLAEGQKTTADGWMEDIDQG